MSDSDHAPKNRFKKKSSRKKFMPPAPTNSAYAKRIAAEKFPLISTFLETYLRVGLVIRRGIHGISTYAEHTPRTKSFPAGSHYQTHLMKRRGMVFTGYVFETDPENVYEQI